MALGNSHRLRGVFLSLGRILPWLLLSPSMAIAMLLPTNMDLIVATLEQAADQALAAIDSLDRISPGAVLIQPQTQHEANWLVDHVLAERLLARGFAVTLDSARVQKGSPCLAYRILDLKVSGRTGLRGNKVERQSHAILAFALSQGDILQWQGEFVAQQGDRIPNNRIDLLGNAAYPFARLQLERKSWSRFVEPIIVSTVMGGLIYLFFSNR